jgi:hypothetical protein
MLPPQFIQLSSEVSMGRVMYLLKPRPGGRVVTHLHAFSWVLLHAHKRGHYTCYKYHVAGLNNSGTLVCLFSFPLALFHLFRNTRLCETRLAHKVLAKLKAIQLYAKSNVC